MTCFSVHRFICFYIWNNCTNTVWFFQWSIFMNYLNLGISFELVLILIANGILKNYLLLCFNSFQQQIIHFCGNLSGCKSHNFEKVSNSQKSVCGRISTFLMSGLWMSAVSYVSPECPPRSLSGHPWFLIEGLMPLDVKNDLTRHSGSSMQNFIPVGALKAYNSNNNLGS